MVMRFTGLQTSRLTRFFAGLSPIIGLILLALMAIVAAVFIGCLRVITIGGVSNG